MNRTLSSLTSRTEAKPQVHCFDGWQYHAAPARGQVSQREIVPRGRCCSGAVSIKQSLGDCDMVVEWAPHRALSTHGQTVALPCPRVAAAETNMPARAQI